MARPTRDAIQAYMSITGASEPLALQRLQEHGGNLAEAVNAHFGELERNIVSPTSGASTGYDFVEDSHQVRGRDSRRSGLPSLLSVARAFRPSLLLDPNYRRKILKQISGSSFTGRPSPPSHTGEVIGFPTDSTWRNDQMHPSGLGEAVDDYARSSSSRGSQIRGDTNRDHGSHLYDNGAEEEMIRAAIEASKKDVQEDRNKRHSSSSNPEEVIQLEDEELARALSLSLKTEKLENATREQIAEFQPYQVEGYNICKSDMNENSRPEPGSSSVKHRSEDVRQKQQIGNRSGHEHHLQHIEESPYPKEWGGIPSEELDEALMLETALFSGMVNNTSHNHLRGCNLEGQSSKNTVNRGEPERSSAVKESLLPVEPSPENENAITLLVRMPDSSRHGRRFLKSDKLKYLFRFIDAGGSVKPGTYKVVRPYPRCAFSLDSGNLAFEELGLTNKQEALFLELI